MPYKDGTWGEKAKQRSKKRQPYFRQQYHKRQGNMNPSLSIGKLGELLALIILDNAAQICRPVDLLWNDLKVDVKTARLQSCNKWYFNIARQKHIADYFLLIGLNKLNIERVFLVPNINLKNYITFSSLSKQFNDYEIHFSEKEVI